MRSSLRALSALAGLCASLAVPAQQKASVFTVRQVMSAPYALGLTAAPVGARFAWIENAEGVRNIWVSGPHEAARQLTHYTEDDGQDIGGLAWSLRGEFLAYTLGAENGAGGKPANPAELQRDTAAAVWVVAVDGKTPPQRIGAGRAPLFLGGGGDELHARLGIDGLGLLLIRDRKIWAVAREVSAAEDAAEYQRYAEECKRTGSDTCALPITHSSVKGGVQLATDRGAAGGMTVSPDGKWLAYVSRRGGHSFIGLYDLDMAKLRFVAAGTGSDSAPSFSRDSKMLAWIREPFTDAPEFSANRVSANPWSVQVTSVADLQARTVYQPEAGKLGSVIPRFATGNPRVWWGAGSQLLFCSEADGWNHLYAVDAGVAGAEASLLTPGKFEVEDVSLSPDGKTVWWASGQVGVVALSGDASAVARTLKLHEGDVDRRHLWQLDLTQARASTAFQQQTFGEGIETRPVASADGTVLAAMASTARTPMRAVLVADGVLTPLHPENVPKEYPAASLVVPGQVVFPARLKLSEGERSRSARYPTFPQNTRKDGPPGVVMIHGQVFDYSAQADFSAALRNDNQKGAGKDEKQILRSAQDDKLGGGRLHGDKPGGGKRPAIVFFHGGPRRQMLLGYPAMDYYSHAYAMNQYLASRGFLVLSVNYRCGIGYGLEFRQCENSGADGAAEYNDALAAVEYLRSRGDVDMKRVGIWGGSYGGYFTALGLARNSDLFAAGVDFHGVHDWIVEDNRDDWLHGTEAEKEAIARRAHASSPMADVDRWRSPVLLIHGDDDPEVAYAQTPLLAEALRARGVPVEELIFPDEVHDFLLHRDWVRAYEATGEFFERRLKP